MKASQIKKIVYGTIISDGSINGKNRPTKRFSLYSKNKEHAEYIFGVLSQLTHTTPKLRERRRGDYLGYEVYTNSTKYWQTAYEKFYPNNGRKALTKYVVDRLDAEALAHVWMCDGYLEHAKNRKLNKVQNIGWLCLEAFPKEELEILQDRLKRAYGISSSLVKKPWGFGYRVRIGGENLQKFISLVYGYILDCFKYKTVLFYKKKSTALDLPSAEHFIVEYSEVDDIVRHPSKQGKT